MKEIPLLFNLDGSAIPTDLAELLKSTYTEIYKKLEDCVTNPPYSPFED